MEILCKYLLQPKIKERQLFFTSSLFLAIHRILPSMCLLGGYSTAGMELGAEAAEMDTMVSALKETCEHVKDRQAP